MPNIVTASQLRSVLGVSSALVSDATLESYIDTAEAVILPMLVANTSGIDAYELKDNVGYFYTIREHYFVEGQSVVISGVPAPFAGTFTITDDKLLPTVFTVAITNADVEKRAIIPAGKAYLSGYNAESLYANTPAVENAVLAVSTEIYQSRTAVGGVIDGADFQVQPYRLSRGLLQRVTGLLAPYIDVETMVN
jgi:hypothetical protein